jgi:adenylate cyclase
METENRVLPATGNSGMGLRTILQILLVALVIPAAGVVAGLVNFEAREALSKLAESHFRSITQGATAKIHEHLGNIPRGLSEIEFLLRHHDLNLDEHDDIKTHLLTQAIGYPAGTMVGYGSNDGKIYVLARRDELGASIVADGESESSRTHGGPADASDFRQSTWYKNGVTATTPAWTKTYRFSNGRAGVSAVMSHTIAGQKPPAGVFHVDIPLAAIEAWLGTVKVGHGGHVFLIHHDGTIAAEPRTGGKRDLALARLLRAGINALGGTLGSVTNGKIQSSAFEYKGERLHMAIVGAEAIADLDWHVGIAVPEDDVLRLANKRMQNTIFFAAAAAILVILLGAFLASRIAGPLHNITRELGEVAQMRINEIAPSKSILREVNTLGEALGSMKSALQSLERYVPPEVARRLVTGGKAATIGVEERRLSIFVSDIEGFTGIAETLDGNYLIEELNSYFDNMTLAIQVRHGTIDKFMGDGILAFFNAPQDVPNHAALSCRAALESVAMTEDVVASRIEEGRPVFRIRVGLAVGKVLVGNVGSSERFGYTVIGDTVNVAARLEGVNKAYGTRIIASDDLRDDAGEGFEWRRLDRVAVAGRAGGLLISELLGLEGEVDTERLTLRDKYEVSLDAYFAGEFQAATDGFMALLAANPADKAATVMAERAARLAAQSVPTEWDGVYVFNKK